MPRRLDRAGERLLAALLASAERKGIRILPSPLPELPWLTLVTLPEQGAGVALLERGDLDAAGAADPPRPAAGRPRPGVDVPGAGGRHRRRTGPRLEAADRQAPDPDRLGVYHLDDDGRLDRVAGRRSSLLAEAGGQIRDSDPLAPGAFEALAERARREQQEAAAFASALEKRPQHATRLLGGACILAYVLSLFWARQHGFGETLRPHGGATAHRWCRPARSGGCSPTPSCTATSHFVHLAVNLIGLISFGGFLEGLLGWRRYLLLYGLSALAGGMASALIAGSCLSVGRLGRDLGPHGGRPRAHAPPADRFLPRASSSGCGPALLVVLVLNTVFSLLPLFMAGMAKIDLYAHAGGGAGGVRTGRLGSAHPRPARAGSARSRIASPRGPDRGHRHGCASSSPRSGWRSLRGGPGSDPELYSETMARRRTATTGKPASDQDALPTESPGEREGEGQVDETTTARRAPRAPPKKVWSK